jgi:hypothetical protein
VWPHQPVVGVLGEQFLCTTSGVAPSVARGGISDDASFDRVEDANDRELGRHGVETLRPVRDEGPQIFEVGAVANLCRQVRARP